MCLKGEIQHLLNNSETQKFKKFCMLTLMKNISINPCNDIYVTSKLFSHS